MPTRPPLGEVDDGPLSRALGQLDDHERQVDDHERRIEDLHKRIRPLEAFAEQGRPLHLERIDHLESRADKSDARWESMNIELTRLRTTIALAGAGIVLVAPLLTALLLKLLH